jgi:NTP pyrophosphatase (non-canonical NTP hydrolase)
LKDALIDQKAIKSKDFIWDAEIRNLQLLLFLEQTLSACDSKLKYSYNDWIKDERVMRIHLITSELIELVDAMSRRDEVDTLDALTDLLYVVLGTATTYDLPIDKAFYEVHASNMSKDDKNDHAAGIKGKGSNYKPPRLREILEQYRKDHVS